MTSASPNPGPTQNIGRVLVADDDAATRLLVSHHLKKAGYHAVLAGNVAEACQAFLQESATAFDALVTDYLMPDGTGLELIEWIKQHDRSLSALIVTAMGERKLIQDSLRGGACDFLDKPIQLPALLKAVETAVYATRRQRRLQEAESSVEEVGRFQQFMLGTNSGNLPAPIEICWHPKHAAGGDLVNVFQLGAGKMLVLVADVSGHDLKAGFISAFFQGIVRGMVEKGTPVQEVFDYFNRFLIREWSGGQASDGATFNVTASVSACAFVIDFQKNSLKIWNSGFPVPMCIDRKGRAERCGSHTSYPLGWFEDNASATFERTIKEDGFAYAWTDGLEDLAAQLGVSPIGLAERLLEARRTGVRLAELDSCSDDILLVRIRLAEGEPGPNFQHIVYEHYFENQDHAIDEHQAHWKKSLTQALPDLPESKLLDVLLCAREAVINGIKYGCSSAQEEPCAFQVNYQPEQRLLRVAVNDPGPGHDFDWKAHAQAAAEQLLPEHRGLALIHSLPNDTRIERNGASLTMDFNLLLP